MKRRISSSLTPLYQYIFPWLLVAMPVLSPLVSAQTPFYSRESLPAILLIIVIFGTLTFFAFRWSGRIKMIEIDAENIYISNGQREIILSLSEVKEVRQNFLATFNPEYVTLILKHQTEFGQKIHFIPRHRIFNIFQHPIVSELRAKINR